MFSKKKFYLKKFFVWINFGSEFHLCINAINRNFSQNTFTYLG